MKRTVDIEGSEPIGFLKLATNSGVISIPVGNRFFEIFGFDWNSVVLSNGHLTRLVSTQFR